MGNIEVMPEIVVTKIRNRWHARLKLNNLLVDEMACQLRLDIGWICREMLRWAAKSGKISDFASAARRRQLTGPVGRVWWYGELERAKARLQAEQVKVTA